MKASPERIAAAIAQDCEACGAKPGESCWLISGGMTLGVPLHFPHRDRFKATGKSTVADSDADGEIGCHVVATEGLKP